MSRNSADRLSAGGGVLLATDFPDPEDADHVLAFNAAGTRLAAGCDRGAKHVYVFDPRSGREVARPGDLEGVTGLAFLAPEVLLIVHLGRCLRCDLRKDRREQLWPEDASHVPGQIPWSWLSAAVSPDRRTVALGAGEELILYDAIKRRVRRRLTSLQDYFSPRHIVFSAGGRYVAARVSAGDRGPWLIVVWDAHSGRRQRTFQAGDFARPLAFRDDTLTLAVEDHGLQLYEADQGEEPAVRSAVGSWVTAVQFGPRGPMLTALLDNGTCLRVRRRTGEVVHSVAPPTQRTLGYATPNADWSRLAAAAKGGVFVWQA
jgi:hypothetical protein